MQPKDFMQRLQMFKKFFDVLRVFCFYLNFFMSVKWIEFKHLFAFLFGTALYLI